MQLLHTETETTVTVAGFIDTKRDHGGLLFATIRDRDGIIQCVFEENTQAFAVIDKATRESVVSVTGKLRARSKETVNPELATGEIEIQAEATYVLSHAKPLSFDNNQHLSDEIKLRERHLYLRRESMQRKLKLRADLMQHLRNSMIQLGFTEVQTPILTASSPEGARDYVVPSYEHKGMFYALPQAPQQFKQILMASGVDRYFQIAPCFRAEASRADRSPGEFYQLDFELAYSTQEEVFEIAEKVIYDAFEKFYDGEVKKEFPVFSYKQAMEEFCCDKPDLRNPLRFANITKQLQNNPPAILENVMTGKDFCAKILPTPNANTLPRRIFDQLQTHVQSEGLGGLAYAKLDTDTWTGPGAKMIPGEILDSIKQSWKNQKGVVFLLAGSENIVNKVGGNLRNHIYFDLMETPRPQAMHFCWVNDYPLFTKDPETNKVIFSHNPFSMPQGGKEALKADPLEILAYQYDLVCNGIELCSGAVRNHDPESLRTAFQIAGYDLAQVNTEFHAMLHAFECGVPPHAGAAPGIDRIIMLLANEENIREVIAFPLSQNAQDLMMKAPSHLTNEQLKALGLKIEE